MNRRKFNALLASGVLSSCVMPPEIVKKVGENCKKLPTGDERLRIDVHCHLLNQDDAYASAFLTRRYIPDYLIPKLISGAAIRGASNVAGTTIDTMGAEIEKLEKLMKLPVWKNGGTKELSQKFCELGTQEQRTFVRTDDTDDSVHVGAGRPTGFVSNRLRNAAMMMYFWPNVDIFMPSMIDFYEGRFHISDLNPRHPRGQAKIYNHPGYQVDFYKKLNLATRGRFLPLVSFHPERQANKEADSEAPLDIVKRAIENEGFIGVKLHPSTGINPLNNKVFGCPNTPIQYRRILRPDVAGKINEAMEKLLNYCKAVDVPILTHGSDGLPAHEACMHGIPVVEKGYDYEPVDPERTLNQRWAIKEEDRIAYRDPATWTGAPKHWIEARGDLGNFKLCISHFASRFQDHVGARIGKYEKNLPPVDYLEDGRLKPSKWLLTVLEHLRKSPDPSLMLDLSHMVALCYSQAIRTEMTIETGLFSHDYSADRGDYARAFERFMQENVVLHDSTMYGTDWHMPEVSAIGPEYLDLIEKLLPEAAKDRIMGQNAARFFGLRQGDKTRKRLEEFYSRNGVPLEKVTWMARVDSKGSSQT